MYIKKISLLKNNKITNKNIAYSYFCIIDFIAILQKQVIIKEHLQVYCVNCIYFL